MESYRKFLWACLPALLLLACVSFAGAKKEAQGEVADAAGLLKVRTFCLDVSELTPQQTGGLKRFIAAATKPKGVFAKLNWTLVNTCDSADAVVTLTMLEHEQNMPAGEHVGNSNLPMETSTMSSQLKVQTISQANMLIANRSSGTALYRSAGAERENRVSALESPFVKLLKDLKALSH
jgi:hypothetical protein